MIHTDTYRHILVAFHSKLTIGWTSKPRTPHRALCISAIECLALPLIRCFVDGFVQSPDRASPMEESSDLVI